MGKNGKYVWSILIIIISLFVFSNLYLSMAIGSSVESGQQSEGSPLPNTAWQLGKGWTIQDDNLVGKGYGSASYRESCEEGSQTLQFILRSLEGGLQANININGSNHYTVGFINNENGSLSTYLLRQAGKVFPSMIQNFPGRSIPYNMTQEYLVNITSKNQRIQVYLNKAEQKSAAMMPVIDYYDSNPLPPGKIAFETLNDSIAWLNNVEVICLPPPTDEETPNLGLGYFKRPT
jgi:hypothetical protein